MKQGIRNRINIRVSSSNNNNNNSNRMKKMMICEYNNVNETSKRRTRKVTTAIKVMMKAITT